MPIAEILAIGDELLSGETADTNSSYLDGLLEAAGWTVARHVTVPDDLDAIADAFKQAAQRATLVLSTGGLGPTQDDLTLEGLARALDCPLVLNEAVLESIRQRFAAFGRVMTPNNQRQAMVPAIGEALNNEAGTAPGFAASLGQAHVYLMPGVPREVRWLMTHQILHRIPKHAETRAVRHTIKVMGLGESKLEHEIRPVIAAHPQVRFGFRTLGAENHVKLLAHGPTGVDAVNAAAAALLEVLGPRAFGSDQDDLVAMVVALLRSRSETVAVGESCTGGWVGKLLSDIPGCSAVFRGGVVCYSNELKTSLLGVDPEILAAEGAVSQAVVKQLAEGARGRLGATWGLGVTGIAGPEGGTAEKPVGMVWIAVASATKTEARLLRLPGDREFVRLGAAKAVLDLLRLTCLAEGA